MQRGLPAFVVLVACAPSPSLEIVEHATSQTVRGIDRGVLFIDARWSVPAQRTRLELMRQLEETSVRIVLADIDGAELSDVPELRDGLQGAGEQAWILGGSICLACAGPACVEQGRALVTRPFTHTC